MITSPGGGKESDTTQWVSTHTILWETRSLMQDPKYPGPVRHKPAHHASRGHTHSEKQRQRSPLLTLSLHCTEHYTGVQRTRSNGCRLKHSSEAALTLLRTSLAQAMQATRPHRKKAESPLRFSSPVLYQMRVHHSSSRKAVSGEPDSHGGAQA